MAKANIPTRLRTQTNALRGALRLANATTGSEDTSVCDAVKTLIDGYGQGGGGSRIATGTFVGNNRTSTFTVDDNLGTRRKVLLIQPIGTVVANSAYRISAAICLPLALIAPVSVDVSAYNSNDVIASDVSERYATILITSNNNNATDFQFSMVHGVQGQNSAAPVFYDNSIKFASNYQFAAGEFEWTAIALD